jgi:hypothetical protein
VLRHPDGPTAIVQRFAGPAALRIGLIVALSIAGSSPVSATPISVPPCTVKDPQAAVATAIATPLVKALEARKWKITFRNPDCRAQFVLVTLWMTPHAGSGWPADTKLDVRIAIDTAKPTPDEEWRRTGQTLLSHLDRLWTIPVVKRFRSIVGVEHVAIWFRAGPEVPLNYNPSPESVTVQLASNVYVYKGEPSVEGASSLRIQLGDKGDVINSFSIVHPAMLAKLDSLVPGFASRCSLDFDTRIVRYDGRKHKATRSRDPRCPTCGAQNECSLPDAQSLPKPK